MDNIVFGANAVGKLHYDEVNKNDVIHVEEGLFSKKRMIFLSRKMNLYSL